MEKVNFWFNFPKETESQWRPCSSRRECQTSASWRPARPRCPSCLVRGPQPAIESQSPSCFWLWTVKSLFWMFYDFSLTCFSAPGCQTSPRLLPSFRLMLFRFPPSSPDQGQPQGKASQSPSWKYFLQTLASKSSWFMILFSRMTRDSLRHEKTQLWFDILTPDLLHSPLQLTFESKDPVTHVIRLSTSKATICHATNVRHFPPVLWGEENKLPIAQLKGVKLLGITICAVLSVLLRLLPQVFLQRKCLGHRSGKNCQ